MRPAAPPATTGAAGAPAGRAAPGPKRLLPRSWPVLGLFTMLPVWWFAGFGDLVWPAAAVPLGIWALGRRRLVMPATIGLYGLFVGWVVLSGTQLDRASRLGPFSFRLLTYVTAGLLLVWVVNERRVSRQRIVDLVAWLWVFAIAGGYLGLLFPRTQITTTIASVVLPERLAGHEFLAPNIRPGFAQVQDFLGFDVHRPRTLFAFSNSWGGNVALLTPFFVQGWLLSGSPRRRRQALLLLPVAAVPIVLSVNRGLWISLSVYAAYVVLRTLPRSGTTALKLAAALAVAVAVVLASPLGRVVDERIGGESGDSSRATIYREALEGAGERPVFGHGGPRPSMRPTAPPVGTHGQVWLVGYSQGAVGLAIYLSWTVAALVLALRRRDTLSLHVTAVLVMATVQMFFYNLLPVSLPLIAVALGLALRGPDPAPVATAAPATATSREDRT